VQKQLKVPLIPKDEPMAEKKEESEPLLEEEKSGKKEKPGRQREDNKDFRVWTLRFDGSRCRQGSGAGVELISPTGSSFLTSQRLQFPCTNNVAEYEALVQGLLLALQKKVRVVQVFGDSELVVKQV